MFVLVRTKFLNQADTQPVKCFKLWKGYAMYIRDIKLRML